MADEHNVNEVPALEPLPAVQNRTPVAAEPTPDAPASVTASGEPVGSQEYKNFVQKTQQMAIDGKSDGLSETGITAFQEKVVSLSERMNKDQKSNLAGIFQKRIDTLNAQSRESTRMAERTEAGFAKSSGENRTDEEEKEYQARKKGQELEQEQLQKAITAFNTARGTLGAPELSTRSATQTLAESSTADHSDSYNELAEQAKATTTFGFDVRTQKVEGTTREFAEGLGPEVAAAYDKISYDYGYGHKERVAASMDKYQAQHLQQQNDDIAAAAKRKEGFEAHHVQNVKDMPIWAALHEGSEESKKKALKMLFDPEKGYVEIDKESGVLTVKNLPQGVRAEMTSTGKVMLYEGGTFSMNSSNNRVPINGEFDGHKITGVNVDIQNDPLKQTQYLVSEQKAKYIQTIAINREIESLAKLQKRAHESDTKIAAMGPEFAALKDQMLAAVQGPNAQKIGHTVADAPNVDGGTLTPEIRGDQKRTATAVRES